MNSWLIRSWCYQQRSVVLIVAIMISIAFPTGQPGTERTSTDLKQQRKWLWRALASPATGRPLKGRLHQSPPPKSTKLHFSRAGTCFSGHTITPQSPWTTLSVEQLQQSWTDRLTLMLTSVSHWVSVHFLSFLKYLRRYFKKLERYFKKLEMMH
jgi:hypothetical protein